MTRESPPEDALQMFSDVSHAFQTPLTVLKSGLQLLQDSPEEHGSVITAMEQSLEEISNLTRNLLQLARIDADGEQEICAAIDLSAVLRDVVEYVSVICRHNRIELKHFIAKGVTVFGNKDQLREAITNLLSNAVKYTIPCEMRKITVSLTAEDDRYLLTIADTGIGIPPDRVPYIFNRFYRARKNGVSGAGLGLTIVKRIIEKHGGTISVESSVGKGTCMIVRLPSNEALALSGAERIQEESRLYR